mmetsp:Transcript_17004/g.19656  ORF Transcript_17004/g.19656 Transcript_17004/m.19656 type:complete len:321 (-) Transcript_17004:240-1202(-)
MSQFEESLSQFQFSQVIPDSSDGPPTARPSEQSNLSSLDPATQTRIVTDLSRLLLFKALSGEPIDRTKLAKEAWGERYNNVKNMTNAALDKSAERMKNVFGLEVKRIPEAQLKSIPKKFKERMYVLNCIKDDDFGSHSKALHSVHLDNSIEKALLMLVLAFVYCKGEVQNHVRWIPSSVLYRLLHTVDENIPAEPAVVKNKRESIGDLTSPTSSSQADGTGVGLTPDVDILLDKFVHMEYLLKKKSEKNQAGTNSNSGGVDDKPVLYAMGPRALLEIGRKQIIFFCAEILDEQPDPTMLQEIEEDEEEEEEDEEEVEMQE